jgi:hypothetical protein
MRAHRRRQGQEPLRRSFDQRATTMVAADGNAVERRYRDRIRAGVLGGRRGSARLDGVDAFESRDRGVKVRGDQEVERCQHARVDQAGGDVTSSAGIQAQLGVGQQARLQLGLAEQLDLVAERVTGVGAKQWLRAFLGATLGFAQQLPALKQRARIDRAGARRADLEQEVRLGVGRAGRYAAKRRARWEPCAAAQRLECSPSRCCGGGVRWAGAAVGVLRQCVPAEDPAELGVGVDVSVGVAQFNKMPQRRVAAGTDDLGVLDGDYGGAR